MCELNCEQTKIKKNAHSQGVGHRVNYFILVTRIDHRLSAVVVAVVRVDRAPKSIWMVNQLESHPICH